MGRNLLCLDHARVSIRDAIPNQRHAGRHPCILFLYTLLQLRGICVISKLIFFRSHRTVRSEAALDEVALDQTCSRA